MLLFEEDDVLLELLYATWLAIMSLELCGLRGISDQCTHVQGPLRKSGTAPRR